MLQVYAVFVPKVTPSVIYLYAFINFVRLAKLHEICFC